VMCEPSSKKARMETIDEDLLRLYYKDSIKENGEIIGARAENTGVDVQNVPSLGQHSDLPSQYPAPKPGPNHTVCVNLPITKDIPDPYPEKLKDVWDSFHVRMPWSKDNLYPVEDKEDPIKKVLSSRWDLVVESLSNIRFSSTQDIEKAILSYNTRYRGKSDWDFSGLHYLLEETYGPEERMDFFQETLPSMVKTLISSPEILTSPIPLLSTNSSHSITLSQQQVLVILVNAFFCTFPRRNSKVARSEFSNYPGINFNTLFGKCSKRPEAHMEKLKCLLSYFKTITKRKDFGVVTYSRKVMLNSNFPNWHSSVASLSNLHMNCSGTIEHDGKGMLQVDFANKFVGGGVLRSGLVQEEIRFTVCPELIASMLFTEALSDNEVLVIVGVEQFSKYKGYADTFTFDGQFQDSVLRDSSGRKETSIVAMDAIRFNNIEEQFLKKSIDRELNKAYIAFHNNHPHKLQSVATGNWGCGAFGGDPRLKFLLQLLAASEAGRDVAYFSFGDASLVADGEDLYSILSRNKITVGDLYNFIRSFISSNCELNGKELFRFIQENVNLSKMEENLDSFNEVKNLPSKYEKHSEICPELDSSIEFLNEKSCEKEEKLKVKQTLISNYFNK